MDERKSEGSFLKGVAIDRFLEIFASFYLLPFYSLSLPILANYADNIFFSFNQFFEHDCLTALCSPDVAISIRLQKVARRLKREKPV